MTSLLDETAEERSTSKKNQHQLNDNGTGIKTEVLSILRKEAWEEYQRKLEGNEDIRMAS